VYGINQVSSDEEFVAQGVQAKSRSVVGSALMTSWAVEPF